MFVGGALLFVVRGTLLSLALPLGAIWWAVTTLVRTASRKPRRRLRITLRSVDAAVTSVLANLFFRWAFGRTPWPWDKDFSREISRDPWSDLV